MTFREAVRELDEARLEGRITALEIRERVRKYTKGAPATEYAGRIVEAYQALAAEVTATASK